MKIANMFPSWFKVSTIKYSPAWQYVVLSIDEKLLLKITELVDDEMSEIWPKGIDDLSMVSAQIIEDIVVLEKSEEMSVEILGRFLRFEVSNTVIKCANMQGRFGHSFDWIACSIALQSSYFSYSKEEAHIENPINVFMFPLLPVLGISNLAKIEVPNWISELYYYGRKHGGHRQLLHSFYDEATKYCCDKLITANGNEFNSS